MSKTVIALDIGGTNPRVALVDEEYNILAEVIRDGAGFDGGFP